MSPLADISRPAPVGRTLAAMSERLVIPDRADVESEVPVARPWWQFSARYNVAVSQSIPVARMHDGECEGVIMRWGFVPASAKGDVGERSWPRVRTSALDETQELRTAWVHGQRGIAPLAGFYLWQRTAAGHRQPYYVRLVNRLVFGVAVLWERSESETGDVIESCALLMAPANPLLAEIDPDSDQMPAILRREDYAAWLQSNVTQASELLQTYPPMRMVTHPVAPHVNHLEFDEPRLIRPVPPDPEVTSS